METANCSNADGGARRSTIGLTEALERYFVQQLEARRKLGAAACPGEEVCSRIGPIANFPHKPIDEVCGGCSKKDTKPGTQPGHLAEAIAEAYTLDELKQCGATFAYPDALDMRQWVYLRTLERARNKEQEKARPQQAQASEQARLQALVGKGKK